MTQTTGRFFDELGKLITDAAGAVIEVHAGTVLVLSPHVVLPPATEAF